MAAGLDVHFTMAARDIQAVLGPPKSDADREFRISAGRFLACLRFGGLTDRQISKVLDALNSVPGAGQARTCTTLALVIDVTRIRQDARMAKQRRSTVTGDR
jgi:hypothetical protein